MKISRSVACPKHSDRKTMKIPTGKAQGGVGFSPVPVPVSRRPGGLPDFRWAFRDTAVSHQVAAANESRLIGTAGNYGAPQYSTHVGIPATFVSHPTGLPIKSRHRMRPRPACCATAARAFCLRPRDIAGVGAAL